MEVYATKLPSIPKEDVLKFTQNSRAVNLVLVLVLVCVCVFVCVFVCVIVIVNRREYLGT